MKICLAGINHQTAPVAIREKVAISSEKLDDALLAMKAYLSPGILLSTCNRTEVYTIGPDGTDGNPGFGFLRSRLDMPEAELVRYTYSLSDGVVVEHLFRVACGLESMITGEYEVLGQVGNSLKAAERAGMVNLPLRYLFQRAIRTGRRAREETGISRHAVSVSSVAVELAASVIGKLEGCRMLVIGTGEAGRLVARAARDQGVSRMAVVGRTMPRARTLAKQLDATPLDTDGLPAALARANVVISCSGAPHYTLSVGQIKRAMAERPELPLVILDIAVPRNIEPAVARIGNVYLYNIDDIIELSNKNLNQRELDIAGVERIIAEEMASFHVWWREQRVRSVIKALAGKVEAIRRSHLNRTLQKMPELGEAEKHRLEMMTRAIARKTLRDPIQNLKANGHEGPDYLGIVEHLFNLETGEDR